MSDPNEAPIPLFPTELHRVLAAACRQRLTSAESVPDATLALEEHFLADECARVEPRAAIAPKSPSEFRAWFEDLVSTGPGQNDPLFDFLAESASSDQMHWFLAQEAAGESCFDDLVAVTQTQLAHEGASKLASRGESLAVARLEIEPVWESLAIANLMAGFALQRAYLHHSAGALAVIELTAPARLAKVGIGLRRLGIDANAHGRYALDAIHARRWNDELIDPVVRAMPEVSTWIAQGALARLFAGKRAFDRYRIELGLSAAADTTIRRPAPIHASAR